MSKREEAEYQYVFDSAVETLHTHEAPHTHLKRHRKREVTKEGGQGRTENQVETKLL